MDRDCARFKELWLQMSEAERDRMFPSLDKAWKRVFALIPPPEPEPKPQAEVQVQKVRRCFALEDAADRKWRHQLWLQGHIADAPAPYDC